MQNAVGMWFTFLALGVTYYALPKLLNRPIYSYALGVLGFWTNLVFYPIIGAHGGHETICFVTTHPKPQVAASMQSRRTRRLSSTRVWFLSAL